MSQRTKTAMRRLAAERFPAGDAAAAAPLVEQTAWWREAESGLTVQPTSPKRPASLRRRLVLAGAAAVVVVGTAVALPSWTAGTAYAATPPMLTFAPVASQQNVGEVLTGLARRARTQPPAKGGGRYHYIHTQGWYLHVSADQNNRILDSGIAAVDRQLWLAPDGSGRLKTTDGTSMAPNMTLKRGEFTADFLADNAAPDVVRAKVNSRDTPAGWVNAFDDLWSHQVVPPAVHATMLDILAHQPGLTLLGTTTDRVGRPGIAVSVEDKKGPTERRILVFDPDTGALLDSETIVLEKSDLPVHPPATTAYTVWLTSGYTDSTEQQP